MTKFSKQFKFLCVSIILSSVALAVYFVFRWCFTNKFDDSSIIDKWVTSEFDDWRKNNERLESQENEKEEFLKSLKNNNNSDRYFSINEEAITKYKNAGNIIFFLIPNSKIPFYIYAVFTMIIYIIIVTSSMVCLNRILKWEKIKFNRIKLNLGLFFFYFSLFVSLTMVCFFKFNENNKNNKEILMSCYTKSAVTDVPQCSTLVNKQIENQSPDDYLLKEKKMKIKKNFILQKMSVFNWLIIISFSLNANLPFVYNGLRKYRKN